MASVELRAVTKRWGDFVAVDEQSLTVHDREFLALLGPSGCGKTTALRMIAGLEEPSAGDILIGGRVVTDALPKDRDVAMVFQNYGLYPHMTVAGNIAYPLRLRGVRKADIDARVKQAADNGKIRQLDTPEVIHDAPADLFVAGFIGSPPMNLIPGALADGRFVAPEINLSLPQTAGATKPRVVFGARPEDIEVVDDGDGHFRAQVYAFEKIGDSALATVEVAAHRITVRTDRGARLNIGDTVKLRVDLTRARLFDASTGLRMRELNQSHPTRHAGSMPP